MFFRSVLCCCVCAILSHTVVSYTMPFQCVFLLDHDATTEAAVQSALDGWDVVLLQTMADVRASTCTTLMAIECDTANTRWFLQHMLDFSVARTAMWGEEDIPFPPDTEDATWVCHQGTISVSSWSGTTTAQHLTILLCNEESPTIEDAWLSVCALCVSLVFLSVVYCFKACCTKMAPQYRRIRSA